MSPNVAERCLPFIIGTRMPAGRFCRGKDMPMDEPIKPTTETERPNLSTEHQKDGDARRPSDTLDRDREPPVETEPRKSSLL
jgi:hypothetical protein